MNKCPRCGSEILKEECKYCPICGALLDYEIAEAASKILNTLLNNYKTYECEDAEEEKYRALVVGALGIGIRELERTAQEVPVQEQLKCEYLGCNTKLILDDVEVAPGIVKKKYVCEKHLGELTGNFLIESNIKR